MIFRQLFDSDTSTYTYLLADEVTRDGIIIDPVAAQVGRDAALVADLGISLKYVLETHVHADHVTGGGSLRDRLGAKTVVSRLAGVHCADVHVDDGDQLAFGAHVLKVRATPGHTAESLTFVLHHGDQTLAFTGDALFVRGCGRTDFQAGDAHALYRSVWDQIYSLPDETLVYPGHDYRGNTVTTVREEKAHNPRLNSRITQEQFVAIMNGLELARPRHMDVAVPANLACGAGG